MRSPSAAQLACAGRAEGLPYFYVRMGVMVPAQDCREGEGKSIAANSDLRQYLYLKQGRRWTRVTVAISR